MAISLLTIVIAGEGEIFNKGKSPVEKRLAEVQRLLEKMEPQPRHHDNMVHRLLEEVEMRSRVFYSIIVPAAASSQETLRQQMDMVRVLNETWAGDVQSADIAFFIQGEERETMDDNQLGQLRGKDFPNNVHQLTSSNLAAELQVLRYLCQHKLNSTKWFFIASSDLYVKSNAFEDYLTEVDALHYHYGYLGKPIKRDPIGRVCMPGTGSVLSHQTLQEMCSKLDDCELLQPLTDCVLGECIRRLVPRLQCNKEGRPHELFVRFVEGKRGPITEQRHRVILDKALIIYPVSDPKLMYAIHQQMAAGRLNQSQYVLQETKNSLDQMDDLLPQTNIHSQQDIQETAVDRDDVTSWKLINGNLLMSEEEGAPALKIPAVWKKELDILIGKSMEYLASWDEETNYSFKRIVNGYYQINPQTGIDYIIDFEGKQAAAQSEDDFSLPAKHFRVALSRKFDSLEINPVLLRVPGVEEKHVTIAVFMIAAEHDEKFQNFMKMLKRVLEHDQRVSLILVKMSSNNERVQKKSTTASVPDPRSIISLYETKYPQVSFTVLDSPTLLSRDHGIALVIRELRPNDIVLLADLNSEFDSGFLERCRSIPLQGQQVYIPIFFSKADPSLLQAIEHEVIADSISEHSGHWMVRSNSVICLYAGDVLAAAQQPGAKGIPSSVNVDEMYRALIEKGYEVVQATDKGLWRVYDEGEKGCGRMVGEEVCSGDNGQDYAELYTKMQLSVALFDHEGEDKF